MIYAYASMKEGVPFANGAPNLTVDIPAMLELSRENEAPICGKDFKTGQTMMKTVLAPAFKARLLGTERMVFDQHPRQPRRGSAGRSRIFQNQGRIQTRRAGTHTAAATLSRTLRQHLPQGPHQLLPAARRQQRRMGQHRHLRMARLSHADQSRLPLPRLDPGRADRARPGAVPRSGPARRN